MDQQFLVNLDATKTVQLQIWGTEKIMCGADFLTNPLNN